MLFITAPTANRWFPWNLGKAASGSHPFTHQVVFPPALLPQILSNRLKTRAYINALHIQPFLAGAGRDLPNTRACPWPTEHIYWAQFVWGAMGRPTICGSLQSCYILNQFAVSLSLVLAWRPLCFSMLVTAKNKELTFVCLHFCRGLFWSCKTQHSHGFRLCDYKRPEEHDRLLTGEEKCASGIYELMLVTC